MFLAFGRGLFSLLLLSRGRVIFSLRIPVAAGVAVVDGCVWDNCDRLPIDERHILTTAEQSSFKGYTLATAKIPDRYHRELCLYWLPDLQGKRAVSVAARTHDGITTQQLLMHKPRQQVL